MKNIIIIILIINLATLSIALPSKAYLSIPFLCQAPYADWEQPWQDGCEEAAIIMTMRYVRGESLNKKSGNQEILDLVSFQKKKYGGHYDLTAEKCAQLIKDYYEFDKIEVRYDVTVGDIKKELAKGNPVITPMAGRVLGNPYYTPPGPPYHYMVFKGYNDKTGQFVANDMGTRRGKNYRYKYKVAYNAIHDWTGSKKTIKNGRKAMIVVKLK